MARRKSREDPDKDLADLVVARWWQADEYRATRIPVWDKSFRDHDPAYIDKKVVTRPPYVKYPHLDRVLITQVSMVMEATDAGGRWMLAHHLSPDQDSRPRGESATEYLEWTYRRPAESVDRTNRAASERVAQMGLKYGDAWYHVEWKRGYPCWESVSPYDVWLDARFGEWLIVCRIITLARLLDRAEALSAEDENGVPRDGGRAMKVFKKVHAALKEGLRQNSHIYRAVSETDLDRRHDIGRIGGDAYLDGTSQRIAPEDDPFNAEIVVYEYHETHPDGVVAQVVPGFGGGGENLVLQSEKNPVGVCTMVPFRPRPVDNEQFGIGNGEAAGGPARAIDYNFRASLAVVGAHGWAALLNTRRSNLKQAYMGSLYGLVVQVDDVQRDLAYLNPPQIGPGFHQIGMQIAQMASDAGTGENEVRRGNVGAAKSATASAIAETFSSVTDKHILRQWKKTQEQLAHVTLAVASVHAKETQLVPVLGRRTPGFVEMRPEMFAGPWLLTFGGSSRGTMQQLQMLLNITQTGAATGELDLRETLREAFRLSGENDPERFLMRKDDIPPQEPWREHLMIANGQLPNVSPRENFQQHFQEHSFALQQWAAIMPPTDPRFQRLQVHLQATQMAWQAQMQMMMQQQAQGQGSPPAPRGIGAGPGGPGEPMVEIPRLNGQRQQSNVTAAGQAPGPTGSVPGRQMGAVESGGGDKRARY